jgi:flagellar hook assembly protein FlgD
MLQAVSGSITAQLNLQTAFVDPTAPGGTITNYPNPFHPPTQGTTVAWKLDDDASVRVRIFTLGGDLVRDQSFDRGAIGGRLGLNEWIWDGKNGSGNVVASGGYIALVEASGAGQTLHVMKRKIAVVR